MAQFRVRKGLYHIFARVLYTNIGKYRALVFCFYNGFPTISLQVFIIKDKCLKRVEPEREDSTLFIVGTVRPIDETQFTVVDRYNDGSYCIRIMNGEEGDAARALSDYGLVLFKPSDAEKMKAGLIS